MDFDKKEEAISFFEDRDDEVKILISFSIEDGICKVTKLREENIPRDIRQAQILRVITEVIKRKSILPFKNIQPTVSLIPLGKNKMYAASIQGYGPIIPEFYSYFIGHPISYYLPVQNLCEDSFIQSFKCEEGVVDRQEASWIIEVAREAKSLDSVDVIPFYQDRKIGVDTYIEYLKDKKWWRKEMREAIKEKKEAESFFMEETDKLCILLSSGIATLKLKTEQEQVILSILSFYRDKKYSSIYDTLRGRESIDEMLSFLA
jgi:hypothetical protein